MKLNQIVAIEKDLKQRLYGELNLHDRLLQKSVLLSGISRKFRPKDEDGDQLPPESSTVQVRAQAVLKDIAANRTRYFDTVATKDTANTQAKANVVVDGEIILKDVPVTTLITLEKELTDLRTLVGRITTLDPTETWHWDDAVDCYVTDPVETVSKKKIPRNHVLWEPPDSSYKQPAQVEKYFEDVVAGYWTTVKFSGALPASRRAEIVERVNKLREAVKVAREEANGLVVVDAKIGESIFGYLLGEEG